jgi:hypothetical protein
VVVVTRFRVTDEVADAFARDAVEALEELSAGAGFVRGHVGRNVDDPELWALVTEWDGVGSYRRALGGFDVKLTLTPLAAYAVDEPGAYEIVGTSPRAT